MLYSVVRPTELIRLTEVSSQQIAVSNEARVHAEVRVAELATQLGFTREAVISFFQIVGEQDVPLEKVPLKLNEIAARHRDLLDRWSVLDTSDPVIANLAEQARQAIETGRYDEADSLLLRACEQDIAAAREAEILAQQAREAAERRLLRAAQSEEKRGDVAMTRLRYSDAAEYYAAAADFVPASVPDRRSSLLSRRANALYCQGCERGDNDALRHCVETFRLVLEGVPRERVPLQWAAIQNNLGNALWDLGKPESGTAHLEEAVAAYRAALEVRTRDRAPLQWATTQMNLGNVLATLGKTGVRDGMSGPGGGRLPCCTAGNEARADTARLGDNTEQSRQRTPGIGRAGVRDGMPRGCGFCLSGGAGSEDP
jgi:tetratricopeptide (TPR) repeat protein